MSVAVLSGLAVLLAFVGLGAAMNYEERKDNADLGWSCILIVAALICAFVAGHLA